MKLNNQKGEIDIGDNLLIFLIILFIWSYFLGSDYINKVDVTKEVKPKNEIVKEVK